MASVNYTNADEEAQKAYDAAVEAANAIVAKEGTNADSAKVQAALEEVKAAKDALNGDSNLANAKQKAQDAIDKLNNLNDGSRFFAKSLNNCPTSFNVTIKANLPFVYFAVIFIVNSLLSSTFFLSGKFFLGIINPLDVFEII